MTVIHPGGDVMPGPCGVPGPAGGGAFGIEQVWVSVTRQAGLLPIKTVGHPTPIVGGPCMAAEVMVVEGNGIALVNFYEAPFDGIQTAGF